MDFEIQAQTMIDNSLIEQYSQPKTAVSHRLLTDAIRRLSTVAVADIETEIDDWLDENYLVDRPRNMQNAAILPAGNIQLADYQRKVLKEALSRNSDGKLNYSTIVWSEPKKSGKTAIAAGVALYMAEHSTASHIYCLANDGKQSKDRIFQAMARCMQLHQIHGGIYKTNKVVWNPPTIRFANGSKVEAIPCDAAGEAGAEPLMTVWSEMWGYAQQHKERLWSEMTIPPTLYGYAMRWIESYAGYEDESTILWNLYDAGVNQGRRHPGFPDLPVWINDRSRQLTFWSEEHRMPWQTQEYYDNEAVLLLPNEFLRIHKNQWVTSTTSLFDDIHYWDRCANPDIAKALLPGDNTPMVVAIDASVSGDCSAIIGVTRHPDDGWDDPVRRVVERYIGVWYPPKGGKLNYTYTLEPAIKKLADDYNIYKFVYDPYQLHKMCTDLRIDGVGAFQEFSQHGRRLAADKQLYDMIIHRQYIHSGAGVTRQHAMNTAAKTEGRHIRFIKKSGGRPIDLMVAASMCADEILRLNV